VPEFLVFRNGQKEALKFFQISAFLMFGNVLFNLERAGTGAIGRVRQKLVCHIYSQVIGASFPQR
jgi:hypothetical protein